MRGDAAGLLIKPIDENPSDALLTYARVVACRPVGASS
jgi:hypothetical protein